MSINLKLRLISGAILAASFFVGIIVFRPLFIFLIFLSSLLMLIEWFEMTNKSPYCLWSGLIIIPAPIISILLISEIDKIGWFIVTYAVAISLVDTGAMFGGKLISGPKLAPIISPKKTISGLMVGALVAGCTPLLLSLIPSYNLSYLFTNNITIMHLSFCCVILGFISQASDLFISIFKRKFKIKDTGTIIPGHGGVLDRFDSYILTAPLVLIYLKSNLY